MPIGGESVFVEATRTSEAKVVPIEIGRTLRLDQEVLGIEREGGRMVTVPRSGQGPPERIDGHTIGLWRMEGDPPHAGEVHPDGDELLVLLSGRVSVRLELPDGDQHVDLGAGEALVVPKGVWHLITRLEPGQLLNVTPGPNGGHRPLPSA